MNTNICMKQHFFFFINHNIIYFYLVIESSINGILIFIYIIRRVNRYALVRHTRHDDRWVNKKIEYGLWTRTRLISRHPTVSRLLLNLYKSLTYELWWLKCKYSNIAIRLRSASIASAFKWRAERRYYLPNH